MADFSRYTNYGDMDIEDSGVSSIVFGANSTILEVELNEMQDIQNRNMRRFIKHVIGDGISDISKITISQYDNEISVYIHSCYITYNGYLLNIADTIAFDNICKSDEDATVYLWVCEKTVDHTEDFPRSGYLNSLAPDVENWSKDDRANNETTRRKIVNYKFSKSIPTDSSYSYIPIVQINKGECNILIDEINLTKISSKVNDIDNMNDVYGVEVDYISGRFYRLAGSRGKYGGIDHNAIDIFNRRRCNVTDDGYVTAYYGDSGYSETGFTTEPVMMKNGTVLGSGTRVQVMVEQPKFYYKVVPVRFNTTDIVGEYHLSRAKYYISATQKKGFKIHPAFVVDGKIKDKIYIGAYEAGWYDADEEIYDGYSDNTTREIRFDEDKLSSIGDAILPIFGADRSDYRTLARNIGTGWGLKTFAIASMDQLLFLIEYASLSSRSILGIGNTIQSPNVPPDSILNVTGTTSKYGNNSNITDYNGRQSITYRGEENIYGNVCEFIDGINIHSTNHSITWSNNFYDFNDDDVIDGIYCNSLPVNTGYVDAFIWNETNDWAFIPSAIINDKDNAIKDTYFESNSIGYSPAIFGGTYHFGENAGMFSMGTIPQDTEMGCRLVYVPDVQ